MIRPMLATARRVLTQLRHDPRSVALMILVPSLLMLLLRYVFNSRQFFDQLAPALLGFFPFLLMFLMTSITMLRERTSGTLERLLTTPIGKFDLIAGYGLAFSVFAVVQVVVALLVSTWLGLHVDGPWILLLLIALLNALLGVALGLLCSAFAHTEFQAMQFVPVVVVPQLLLCGLFQPRAQMAGLLSAVSDVMPLSYAVDGINRIASSSQVSGLFWRDVVIVLAVAVGGLALAAVTMPRQTR